MFSGVSVSFLGRLPCGSNIVSTRVVKADDEDTITCMADLSLLL